MIHVTRSQQKLEHHISTIRTLQPVDLNLYSDLENKKVELDKAWAIITILEDKVQHSEEEFIKEANKFKGKREEMADEIKLLKKTISNFHAEESLQQKALKEVRKALKTKEKENYNL